MGSRPLFLSHRLAEKEKQKSTKLYNIKPDEDLTMAVSKTDGCNSTLGFVTHVSVLLFSILICKSWFVSMDLLNELAGVKRCLLNLSTDAYQKFKFPLSFVSVTFDCSFNEIITAQKHPRVIHLDINKRLLKYQMHLNKSVFEPLTVTRKFLFMAHARLAAIYMYGRPFTGNRRLLITL